LKFELAAQKLSVFLVKENWKEWGLNLWSWMKRSFKFWIFWLLKL